MGEVICALTRDMFAYGRDNHSGKIEQRRTYVPSLMEGALATTKLP